MKITKPPPTKNYPTKKEGFMFLGRIRERTILDTFYESKISSYALVYGRRRIGKTELIRQSLNETKIQGIYYECKQTSEENNVSSLAEIISEAFKLPRLAFNSMEELLEFLFNYAISKKLILAIDEYSFLRDVVPGMDSIIQVLIDKYKDSSKLKLILCGSFVDTMQSLIEVHNPLYGRIDLTIDLKPMDYYESSLFYDSFSNEDKVRLYSVFGGVPYYNRLIDSKKSVRQNIIDLIASPNSRLENEVIMHLKSEISKMTNANEVFETLAKGYTKFVDILSQAHINSSATLSDILEKLLRMDVVKKEAPINDENNKKKSGYFISDNLSHFYYKYIFRNLSRLAVMDSEDFYDRFIDEDFEQNYVPHIFEDICKQFLIRKNREHTLKNHFEKIGKYYYDIPSEKKNGEFDIVTENKGTYIFYEAKFRKGKMTASMIAEEIAQVEKTTLRCKKYGFFSRSGFGKIKPENATNLILYTLKDLFAR